jgi:glycosyltransferase involved in cell wall biosynthesis
MTRDQFMTEHKSKSIASKLSVVVIFHNMRREAERTLFSLSSGYQTDVSDDDYEVIAVDSNSSEPLDESMVRSFGPQFRYLNVRWDHPSPCRAMNLGVAAARSEIVLCVIDGARILSPGILGKVLRAFRQFDNPFVYSLGMHLGPKVQNESMLEGYNQIVEDKLLEGSHWKDNGYSLFPLSSLALSSKQGFYSKLSESNCFALRKTTYERIGGFDERFITPGGGLINLDVFNRAVEQEDVEPVMLLGEATFHQYHGGVATNVPMTQHPWATFAEEYHQVRGKEFATVFKQPHYLGEIVPEALHLARIPGAAQES